MSSTVLSNSLHQFIDEVSHDLGDSSWRSLVLLAVAMVLLLAEAPSARREGRPRDYRQSYQTNIGTLLFNDTLLSLLSISSLWVIASQYSGWGFLSSIESQSVKALLAFVLLDLTMYLWHRANHQFEWLWRFHKVHHSDRVMNVSTAFRLHVVEVFFTVVVKALFIVVAGVDATLVVASEALMTLCVLFHHAHIRFRGERLLGRITIMPYLHRTHHSTVRAEHDSNYGAVLSCWDRLLGTFSEAVPEAIGLAHVPGQNFLELLRFGFAPNASGMSAKVSPSHDWIAEAAYYLAEKRGFAPGDDVRDWFEAEQQLRQPQPQP
jgi:sterol desaturase/sphingolipid hydroxylase (fatty acid hydroxylase superfamily)